MINQTSGFKMLSDNQWLAWYSNNFEDKEQEIVSLEAHQKFIDGANNGLYPMPELWFYHLDGTRHGITKSLYMIGHFAVAFGEFDSPQENEFVTIMKSWYDKQEMITLSHGFYFDPKQKIGNVYKSIRTHEISTLPSGREANEYTNFVTMRT
jgi:hypothetical protein